MSSNTFKKTAAMAMAALAVNIAFAFGEDTLEYQTSGVTPGRWTSDFEAARAYADNNNVPMLAFWGSTSCGWCKRFKRLALNTPEFSAWVKDKPLVLLCTEASNPSLDTDVKTFTRGTNNSGQYPYVRLYWHKKDGTLTSVCFTGRKDSMPGKGLNVVRQFLDTLNMYFSAWDGNIGSVAPVAANDYSGEFLLPDTEAARLEYIPGVTESVTVPLVRTNATVGVATNVLAVSGGAAKTLVWAANEKEKYVTLPVAGRTGDLELALSYKGAVHSKSAIFAVEEPENSPKNPKWMGEEFDFGEWTMDVDAAFAKTKAAKGDAATIVFFTGALWCPWCLGLENYVLDTEEFREMARTNQISLALIDERKRSPSDSTTTQPYAVSVVPNGAAPSLLAYEVGSNGRSGAGYLSRKGIAKADADAVLLRNQVAGYPGGRFHAPETLRTGYPTVIIFDKNGVERGRFVRQADSSSRDENGAYYFNPEENMARMRALVGLAKNDIVADENKYATTTTLTHEFGASASVRLGVSENATVYRLSGFAGRRAIFKIDEDSAGADATLSILKIETVGVDVKGEGGATLKTIALQRGKSVLSGTGEISYRFPATGTYYLKVSAYGSATTTLYGETGVETTVKFHSAAMPSAEGNPYIGQATSASIPIMRTVGTENYPVGTLSYTATAAGQIRVKYARSVKAGSTQLRGAWGGVDYDGVAHATLSGRGVTINLSMDATGAVSATVSDPLYGAEPLASGESLVNGTFADFQGYYTVALPVLSSTGVATGTGYAIIKATTNMAARNGKVTCQLMFPDGKTSSVSATMELLADGWAGLTIVKKTSQNTIYLPMKIRPKTASAPSHRAVVLRDDATARWDHVQAGNTFSAVLGVHGSLYNKRESYLDVAGSDELTLEYDTEGFSDSPTFGGVSYILGAGEAVAVADAKLTAQKQTGFSLRVSRATGIVSGTARIAFENDRTMTAKIRGAIVPNWNDCGCFEADTELPLTYELPFVPGAVYYKEKIGGANVQRSFPFGLWPVE